MYQVDNDICSLGIIIHVSGVQSYNYEVYNIVYTNVYICIFQNINLCIKSTFVIYTLLGPPLLSPPLTSSVYLLIVKSILAGIFIIISGSKSFMMPQGPCLVTMSRDIHTTQCYHRGLFTPLTPHTPLSPLTPHTPLARTPHTPRTYLSHPSRSSHPSHPSHPLHVP